MFKNVLFNTFLIIVFAFVHSGNVMNETPNMTSRSMGSSKGTVSNWLNRLLPHPAYSMLPAGSWLRDPIDLAEQGFPHFIRSWSLWEFNERHRASWEERC